MLYLLTLGGGLILSMLLFELREHKVRTMITTVLAVVLGLVLAKLLYVLPLLPSMLSQYGMSAFIRMNPEEFSIWGGAAGVCLAVWLAAPLSGLKRGQVMDKFAPSGALLLCVARGAEYFLGTNYIHHGAIGLGDWVQDGSWNCFFPLAVQDEYSQWYVAVFFIEAVIALIAVILSLTVFSKKQTFARTAYFIMAGQIFTEMMHSQTISWSFVRMEQLYCAVAMLIMLFGHCRHAVETKGAFKPCAGFLIMIAVTVYIEFEMDKSWLSGLLYSANNSFCDTLASLDAVFCYAVLFLIVVGMLLMEHRAIRNRT